jgi:ribonuclease Z
MFEVVFLGTSASSPSVYRSLSAHMILHRQYRFLLDCGEGTQQQILRSGLGFKRLDKVLLTHGHLDHILGLGGLASTLGRWEMLERLEIYAGRATLKRVARLIFGVVFPEKDPPSNVELIALDDGDVILEDDKFRLSTFLVSHLEICTEMLLGEVSVNHIYTTKSNPFRSAWQKVVSLF